MLIKYQAKSAVLTLDGCKRSGFIIKNLTGESINFEIANRRLIIDIPFFLTKNIFYRKIDADYYIADNISEIPGCADKSETENAFFKENGFFPLDLTGYKDIGILCSYLKYSFGEEICVELHLDQAAKVQTSIESIAKHIEVGLAQKIIAFRKQSQLPIVVPLSGGMDSRLILWLAAKYDKNIVAVTHGEKGAGDLILAQRVIKRMFPTVQHKLYFLEEISADYVQENLESCDRLLPVERVLYPRIGEIYKDSLILSGLYGDVILADSELSNQTFKEYIQSEAVFCQSALTKKMVEEYDKIYPNPRFNRVLLRCQKLTRLGLNTIKAENVVCPFMDTGLIYMVSGNTQRSLYKKVIEALGASNIFTEIHQTSCSYFHHPRILRLMQKAALKLIRHPYSRPYYTSATVKRLS